MGNVEKRKHEKMLKRVVNWVYAKIAKFCENAVCKTLKLSCKRDIVHFWCNWLFFLSQALQWNKYDLSGFLSISNVDVVHEFS